MSNQKTTELRTISATDVSRGDWIPIVDVSELTSPTGETKKISASDLSEYIVSGGFVNYAVPQHGYQNSNGLSFAPNFAPLDELNMHCYGNANNLGDNFSINVRAFIPSDSLLNDTGSRVLFGVGSQVIGMADYGTRAYIGVQSSSLIGYVNDGVVEKIIEYPDFIRKFPNRAFDATITKDYIGNFKFYVNAELVGTLTGIPNAINSSYITMGNGQSGSHWNINCVIYEAHVFNSGLSGAQVAQNYYGGTRNNEATLVSSYRPENLNPGPTQWLDSVGDNHLLLPRAGAEATSPNKQFGLIFFSDGTSGYLGNGTQRDVLPDNYVLTDCFVYSPGAPLLSIGSTDDVAYENASGIDSFNNNRVPLVSASYSRNVLPLLELGVVHKDKSLYVFYSASAAPCTFSFQGYTSKYGAINYIPPSPTPTPTPTITITPSPMPPTPTPTMTGTPTPTPPLPPGIYLSANSFKLDDGPFVFTTNTAITSLTRWKLRAKVVELIGVDPHLGREQIATQTNAGFNQNYSPLNVPPVGIYNTELYYVEYGNTPDIYGNYPGISVNGGAPFTFVTMSVATASTFVPPLFPGTSNVYLSELTYSLNNPPYVYTGNTSVLSYNRYKLRCKISGQSGDGLYSIASPAAVHRTVAYNNNYSQIIPPAVGVVPAELYWITYDNAGNGSAQTSSWNFVTMSCTTASGFLPVAPPAYTSSGHPNVYLSYTTGSTTTFKGNNPPYIYTTDPTVLAASATGSYRLRCKIWKWLPATSEWSHSGDHSAIAWNNQYETIHPPLDSSYAYRFELYWIKYSDGLFGNAATVYSGTPYYVYPTITP